MYPMRQKPNSCHGCACYFQGTDFSQVEGFGTLGVGIVGEASGLNEARDELPFRPYAQAGSVLTRIIRMAGFDRSQFWITNTLRCRPTNDWLERSPWEHSALRHCRPNLDQFIADKHPRALWALGGIALRELTGMEGILSLQGYVLDSTYGIPAIGSVHPALIARGASEYYRAVAEQLKRAVRVAKEGFEAKPVFYVEHPNEI